MGSWWPSEVNVNGQQASHMGGWWPSEVTVSKPNRNYRGHLDLYHAPIYFVCVQHIDLVSLARWIRFNNPATIVIWGVSGLVPLARIVIWGVSGLVSLARIVIWGVSGLVPLARIVIWGVSCLVSLARIVIWGFGKRAPWGSWCRTRLASKIYKYPAKKYCLKTKMRLNQKDSKKTKLD